VRALRRLSIRTRITVGSLLVGAVVLVATALVLHLQLERATAETDRSLAMGDAAAFVADLRSNPDEAPDRPAPGVLVGVRSETGRWLVDALPAGVRDRLPTEVDHETTLRLGTDHARTTVVGVPVSNVDGSFVVWAARDGRAGHETLERIDRSLAVGTILALAAFGGTAWLLATLALRPVGRMRRTAERISAGAAGEHLPVGRSDDELAGLARTLNAFLDGQRDAADRERRMVSDASHELRTPLAALTARLELAHRSSGDAAALERELTAAEGDAARLVALADTLLELTRLDESARPRVPAPGARPSSVVPGARTDARTLQTELMDSIDRARTIRSAGPRDVDFAVELVDPDVCYAVEPAAFARVVDNLVANAIAAGQEGGHVLVELAQGPDGRLDLTVTDDGPGVPADFLPRAFDRFTRADPARRAVLGGSGLGLALVRGIAERAGGTATLANGVDGGAVATVCFPAA
jgi:two-component system, OmpR family, sensor kinase